MKAIIHTGKALDVLKTLPSESVHCCVTSPPYFGLRKYLPAGHPDEAHEIGTEPTPAEYVASLVEVFEEVQRVLRNDGTLWCNLADSYASGGMSNPSPSSTQGGGRDRGAAEYSISRSVPAGLKPKDLIGIPWIVAFALRSAGWWLRQDIIWKKNNCMPESVTDRCTNQHEYIFLLSKSARYYYDNEAIKEESDAGQVAHNVRYAKEYEAHSNRAPSTGQPGNVNNVGIHSRPGSGGKRNRRSVWEVNTKPFPEAHFAVYPPDLIEPCIMAGTSAKGCCSECGAPYERDIKRTANYTKRQDRGQPDWKSAQVDSSGWEPATVTDNGWKPTCDCSAETVPCTVLDPFSGSGTTGLVALAKGCNFIGIELNPDYAEMSRRRIMGDAPLFNNVHETNL